jgi:hypothetical protein
VNGITIFFRRLPLPELFLAYPSEGNIYYIGDVDEIVNHLSA